MSGPESAHSAPMAHARWLHPCRHRTPRAGRPQVVSVAPEPVHNVVQAEREAHLAADAEVSRLDHRRPSAVCERLGALSLWIAHSRSSPPSFPAFPWSS